jgi:hypothetical protein
MVKKLVDIQKVAYVMTTLDWWTDLIKEKQLLESLVF